MLAFGRSLKKTLAAAQNRNEGPNVIIVSSPHPWAWKPLYNVNRGRAKMIFEERDIWPQSLVELAGVPYWHPLILLMNRTMRNIYSTADAIVSLFPCAKQFYIEQNVPDERIHYVSNGIDPDLWDKRTDIVLPGEIANAFSHARNMGKVVVLYAGAMGPPNALDNLLDLEKITPVDRPYHIFLMGDGVSKRDLEARVRSRKIDFVTFLPRVERHIAWAAMKAADILYVGMKKIELYRYGVSPNKVFDYFMAGRPIIQAFVAGNRPVFDAKAGFEADPGNPASIDDAFRRLWAMTPAERDRLGINGRNYVLANHNWQLLGDKYARLCEQVAAEH